MIEYYKLHNTKIYKIIDNKLYRYYYNTRDWKYWEYLSIQYLLKWPNLIPLTLLDIAMMGIPE